MALVILVQQHGTVYDVTFEPSVTLTVNDWAVDTTDLWSRMMRMSSAV